MCEVGGFAISKDIPANPMFVDTVWFCRQALLMGICCVLTRCRGLCQYQKTHSEAEWEDMLACRENEVCAHWVGMTIHIALRREYSSDFVQ